MKLIGYIVLGVIILTIIIPVFIVKGCDLIQREEGRIIGDLPQGDIQISVYNHRTQKGMTLGLEEYLVGVVGAEMPVIFDIEALKAQAVAARTYTLKRLQSFGATPNEAHPQYDLCTDHTHCQAWISKEDRIQAWKEDKNLGLLDHVTLWNKLVDSVASTMGEVITYDGDLIDPLFHSTSGGKTENSEDYFTARVPYLRSVDSGYEDASPHLLTKATMTIKEFIDKLKKEYPDIKIDGKKIEKEIRILDHTEGGKIRRIQIGNKTLSGREAREALGLKSSDFTVEVKGNTMTFHVVGYGHGVGMSQFGADGMAKQGSDYKAILKHYYQGVELVNIESLKP